MLSEQVALFGTRHKHDIVIRNDYIYALLSLAFITVNIITLGNLPPWIDEVMMLDTSYNAAVHGSWETTAWYRVAGQYPFSTYPPLYQILSAVWIKLFGCSLETVRSLNLLVTFLMGEVLLRMMKRHGILSTPWTTVLFTLLLWGTSEMAWMYRNGRPDTLCALFFLLTALAIDKHMSAKSIATRISVIATSAMLLCSGIQASAYLCLTSLFCLIVIKDCRKEIGRLFILLLIGMSLGLLLVALFMLAHGRLVAFASSIIQYSVTLSNISIAVLPWVGEMFGFSAAPFVQKLLELNTDTSLGQRLGSILEYRSYMILSIVALVAYAINHRVDLRNLLHDKGFILLLFAFYVPVVMHLAGRFADYYRWMAFLPLLGGVISIASRHRLWCAVFCVVAVAMTLFNIRSIQSDEYWNYDNLRSFVKRQHFKPADAVVCPFSTFYEMKSVCDTCYFVGIFPVEFLGHVDYIIEAPNCDTFEQRITDYVNKLKKDTTVILTSIDHCEHPSLILYQVRKTHE